MDLDWGSNHEFDSRYGIIAFYRKLSLVTGDSAAGLICIVNTIFNLQLKIDSQKMKSFS